MQFQNLQINLDNISVEKEDKVIFKNLSLTSKNGDLIVVKGNNGAGKTSLLEAIAGLIPIKNGNIKISSQIIYFSKITEICHYYGHLNGLKSIMTAKENLELWHALLKISNNHADGLTPEKALQKFNLSNIKNIPISLLSAGQKNQVALARLLIAYRPLWLLDEPKTFLDNNAWNIFLEIMDQHRKYGGIIIIASHDPINIKFSKQINL